MVKDNKTHRKLGNGLDCAGHNNVRLRFWRASKVRLLSPDVNFGATLPRGSTYVKEGLDWIFVQLLQSILNVG